MMDFGSTEATIAKYFYQRLIEIIEECISTLDTSDKVRERWYKHISRELKQAKKQLTNNEVKITSSIALAFWFYNTLANMGVKATIKPNEYHILSVPEYMNAEKTEEAIRLCSMAIALQYLPIN
jgi:hypothetical protein